MASTRSMARAATRAATMFTLALAITGCGMPSSDETPGYRRVTVTASGPVAVTVGDTVAVMLPANPSTGFAWELDSIPDARVLRASGELIYAPPANQPPMPGAGGTATLRFHAIAAGQARLSLVYRRNWEVGVPPAERVTIAVTVLPASR